MYSPIALTKLANWYREVEELNIVDFSAVINNIKSNYSTIINYFNYRITNASEELFNLKIIEFRAQLRFVRNVNFSRID